MQLIMTYGLPASGKTTWAKEWQQAKPHRVIVCRDDLRQMLHGGKWTNSKEKVVVRMQNLLIRQALEDEKSVCVADTNLAPGNEKRLRVIASEFDNVQFEIKRFDIDLNEAIKRDLQRANPVGEAVIRRMWRQFICPIPAYEPQDWKHWCIMVDIDGTLAEKGDRSPYDMTRVGADTPNPEIIDIVKRYERDHTIIIQSGRSEDGREETEKWLKLHNVPYDNLHMRQEGDKRKDSIVKAEIYDWYVEPYYNVRFVLDDRKQVVDMWREKYGLRVLQVAEGNF